MTLDYVQMGHEWKYSVLSLAVSLTLPKLVADAVHQYRAGTFWSAPLAVIINPFWLLRFLIPGNGIDSGITDLTLALGLYSTSLEPWTTSRVSASGGSWGQWLLSLVAVIGVHLVFSMFSATREAAYVKKDGHDQSPESTVTPTGFRLPPLLIPARTTHTRFFPKKHSFSYSYFYVGIPVGWRGRAGAALSADVEGVGWSSGRGGWFDVQGIDHLSRDKDRTTLMAKLELYLESEGVGREEWSFAYLCTAPRVFGYSFNPVSFWYIYDGDKLTMMILEVNNTFDERRMYLLRAGTDTERNGITDVTSEADNKRFRNRWSKDFHVSPFNSRNGSYSLVAKDLLSGHTALDLAIDNSITLRSSRNETKLVARVFSEGQALDPAALGVSDLLKVFLTWSWVGLLTFPRILFEASRLFFRRKLHVWFRPEVLTTSIGRRATSGEEHLATLFEQYLAHLVRKHPHAVEVKYVPPVNVESGTKVLRSNAADKHSELPQLEIRILTPAFFSRWVHYAHTREAFDREAIWTDEKNHTAYVSDPLLLESLLKDGMTEAGHFQGSLMERWRWRMLKKLRCPAPPISYPESGNSTIDGRSSVYDIRTYGLSDFDRYVLTQCGLQEAAMYRRTATELFLAQRYALGFTELVELSDLLLRVVLLAVPFWWIVHSAPTSTGTAAAPLKGMAAGMPVHVWALLKG